MRNIRNIVLSLVIIVLAVLSIYQTTEAAFSDEVSVEAASFAITDKQENLKEGSGKEEALYFLKDISNSGEESNLTRVVPAPSYDNVSTAWKESYPVKIKNVKDKELYLVSYAMYSGESDPDNLRDDLYVKVNAWDDKNSNGKVDSGETGKLYGENSFLRWKNDTFKLDKIKSQETKGFVFTFDGRGLSEANLNKSGKFSFHIEAVENL